MKKQIAFLLLCCVLLLAAGCGGGSGAEQVPDSVEVNWQHDTRVVGDNITIDMTWPEVSAVTNNKKTDAMLEELNTRFRDDAEAFAQLVQDECLDDAQPGDVFVYAAEERYNRNGMLSIVQCENFANRAYLQYAATYSLGSGQPMSLGEVTGMKQTEAEEIVAKQFGGVVQSDPDTFYADAADYISQNMDKLQYYRANEGLGAFFQAGEIAPEEAGILEMVMQ